MTVQEMALPSPRYVHTPSNTGRNIAMLPPSALAAQHGNILLDPNLYVYNIVKREIKQKLLYQFLAFI